MRHKQKSAAAACLWLLAAVIGGFFCGYCLLPHTALAQLLNLREPLLEASLPFALVTAETPPHNKASALLLRAGLPGGTALELPRQQMPLPPKTNISAAEATAPPLAEKAAPRLILMEEKGIQVYAAAQASTAPSAPLIAVYCTHSSEEYRGETRVPGGRGGVHTVAQRLTESLNKLGLPAIYCDTVHDYPDWDLSYANSLASIQALQAQYPSLEVFIDVHRDSQAPSVLSTANGNMARIMLVAGSDQRLAHPNWKKNQAFSEQIKQALEARVGGITRGVSVQQGRYNQHISDKAILVEMGSTVNTVGEACASAELLAQAIADALKE